MGRQLGGHVPDRAPRQGRSSRSGWGRGRWWKVPVTHPNSACPLREGQEAKAEVSCGSHNGDSGTQWTGATDGLRGAGMGEGCGGDSEGGVRTEPCLAGCARQCRLCLETECAPHPGPRPKAPLRSAPRPLLHPLSLGLSGAVTSPGAAGALGQATGRCVSPGPRVGEGGGQTWAPCIPGP